MIIECNTGIILNTYSSENSSKLSFSFSEKIIIIKYHPNFIIIHIFANVIIDR